MQSAAVSSASVALRAPLRAGDRLIRERNVVRLRLRCDDGAEGIGEASSVDWLFRRGGGRTLRELEELALRIAETRPLASHLLRRSFDPAMSAPARAGLQCALLDLEARRRRISLAELLGAAAGGELAVSALLSGDRGQAPSQAALYTAQGFAAVKLKVGGTSVDEDVAHVLDVRAAAGPRTALRLDANGAWSPEQAGTALRAFAEAGVDFIEEPLADTSPRRWALLRKLRAHLPVAVDESIVDARDLDAVIAEDAADVLVLKLERVGGPLPALALAETARRGALRVVFTDSIESAVGRAATAHVAHAAGSGEALGLGGAFLLAPDASPAAAGTAGCGPDEEPRPLYALGGPGLGVEIGRDER